MSGDNRKRTPIPKAKPLRHSSYSNAGIGSLVKAFFGYTAGAGQNGLKDLGYAPLPSAIQTKVQASVNAVS